MRGTTYLAVGCLSLSAACGGSTSTSPTSTTAAPRIVSLRLDGRVYDTASRPVTGATVELIDGVPVSLTAITDDSGSFSLGDVTLTVPKTTIRVSKEGYATKSDIVSAGVPPRTTVVISLASLAPPVIRPGEYTMAFVADTACDLPEEARMRTYSATMTLRPGYVNLPPEVQGADLDVVLSGASFVVGNVPPANSLGVHVTGDYVRIDLDPWGEDGYISERLTPATYLELTGLVAGSVGASGASSVSFDGTFTYRNCVKPSDTGPFGCSSNDLVSKQCYSKSHRFILTRR